MDRLLKRVVAPVDKAEFDLDTQEFLRATGAGKLLGRDLRRTVKRLAAIAAVLGPDEVDAMFNEPDAPPGGASGQTRARRAGAQ